MQVLGLFTKIELGGFPLGLCGALESKLSFLMTNRDLNPRL